MQGHREICYRDSGVLLAFFCGRAGGDCVGIPDAVLRDLRGGVQHTAQEQDGARPAVPDQEDEGAVHSDLNRRA